MPTKILNNRYRVISTLGRGGFGETFLAEDTYLPSHRQCVIKQLKPLAINPQIQHLVEQRFQREAAILEELGTDNQQIPKLYAYFSETGEYYLVQELILGENLSNLLQKQKKLSENIVEKILLDLLPVLAYIHSKKIVHRDIKPDNIIIRSSDNLPVLIDFGAVKETMGTVVNFQGNSTSSIVIGTPGFMPSEQAAGRPVYSSDLYALGLVAIYLLTGKLPQDLETDSRSGEIIWHQYARGISNSLITVLDRAIMSHPRDRFSTAELMLKALKTDYSNIATVVASPPTTTYNTTKQVAPTSPTTAVKNKLHKSIPFLIIIVSFFGGYISLNFIQQVFQDKPPEDTKPSSTPTESPLLFSSPVKPTPQKTAEKPVIKQKSAEESLKNYYKNINNRNYQAAWRMLSSQSRNDSKRHPEGYKSYTDWWTQVDNVKLISTDTIENNFQASIIESKLNYRLKSGRIFEQKLVFYWLWNIDSNQWLLDDVTRISEQQISSDSPPQSSENSQSGIKPSAAEALRNYYANINNQSYQAAWAMFTPQTRNNPQLHPQGYKSYTDWWTKVSNVDIISAKVVKNNGETSIVEANLKYLLKSGKVLEQKLIFFWVWDSNNNQWLLEKVNRT